MSLDSDSGMWTFHNRNDYPVGVNLVGGDGYWDRIADRYPSCPVRLDLGAPLKALCAPEWLTDGEEPLQRDHIWLYGPTSDPGASKRNMEAYLTKLEVLMRAGALRTLFPYGMELQKNGVWVFFDRDYKPIGMNVGLLPWIRYLAWPVGVRLPDLSEEVLTSLSYSGAVDRRCEVPGNTQVHFYDDSSNPAESRRNMDTYLRKLRTLMLMHGATNSKLPLKLSIYRRIHKVLQNVGFFWLVRKLLTFFLMVRMGA